MKNFYESKLYQVLLYVFELFLLNVITVICSIPIITIGAAYSSLYYSLQRKTNDTGSTFRDYFDCFKSHFKEATYYWLLTLGVLLFAIADLIIIEKYFRTGGSFLYSGLILSVMMFTVFTASYLFPFMTFIRMKFWDKLKTAFLISVKYLPRTIVIAAINILPAVMVYYWTFYFICSIPLWISFGVSCSALINIFVQKPVISELFQESP